MRPTRVFLQTFLQGAGGLTKATQLSPSRRLSSAVTSRNTNGHSQGQALRRLTEGLRPSATFLNRPVAQDDPKSERDFW